MNPRLIYCSMSAFGHAGPMANRPGYEPLLQAFSGLIAIDGDPSGPPSRVGPSVVDLGTGMWTVIGVLAAILERQSTGVGGEVRTSLLETGRGELGGTAHRGLQGDRHHPASGRYRPQLVDSLWCVRGSGRPVVIAAGNDRLFFAKLAAALERPEWASDPRFATKRRAQREQGHAASAHLRTRRPQHRRRLDRRARRRAGAPIHSIPQVLEHPQTHAMDIILDNADDRLKLTGLPLSINGVRAGFGTTAPALDEYHDELADSAPAPESGTAQ
ncbi:CoA transferase [Streptomyces hirsutus]